MPKKIYITLLISLIWFLSCCEIKAWNCDEEVNVGDMCSSLSNWYTEPYCSKGMETDATQCIRMTLSDGKTLLSKNDTSARTVIQNYCKAMLSQRQNEWRVYFADANTGDTRDWERTFDSRQSIFVYTLCSSFKGGDWKLPFVTKESDLSNIFTWGWNIAKILKLQQRNEEWVDKCSWDEKNQLNECDMSIYATEIFSAIMSDMFKIKYAQVFSVDSSKNFPKTQDRITAFFSWYFFITKYEEIKSLYPQTMSVVNSNQKYYKKVLDKLKILDNNKLEIKDNICVEWWNVTWQNFIKCAMHGSQWRGLTLDPPFITMLYNELLNYQIFEKTYQNRLSTKVSWAGGNETERIKYESRIWEFQSYVNKQIDAVYKTLHDLEELNMTYPLHIWLLMYQEKIKKFRDKKLSPVVTLFYSLSEKLQNVQLPN